MRVGSYNVQLDTTTVRAVHMNETTSAIGRHETANQFKKVDDRGSVELCGAACSRIIGLGFFFVDTPHL